MNNARLRGILLPFGFSLLASFSLPSQAYQLMHIPNIPGGSTQEGYEDWIPINSISSEIINQECSTIEISKNFDSASLPLMMNATTRLLMRGILIANIERTASTGEQIETFNVSLAPTYIQSVAFNGSDRDFEERLVLVTESITFNPGAQDELTVECNKKIP